MSTPDYSDRPIEEQDEDELDVAPLCVAIANGIARQREPYGSAFAIYGKWGAGKTSAIKLIEEHLTPKEEKEKDGQGGNDDAEIRISAFECWHYRSEEALVAGFFRELSSGLKEALPENGTARENLVKLGALITSSGPLLETLVSAAAPPIIGKATGLALDKLGRYIGEEKSADALRKSLIDALNGQDLRFLIVIDDLDRMSPDEVLIVLRLIKSVGQLPKVMYLLAYDHDVIEKAVKTRYPLEGDLYLEKIIQASFHLPAPSDKQLRRMLRSRLRKLLGARDADRFCPDPFANKYADGIYRGLTRHMLKTPRDVARLSYMVSMTWPSVAGKVNPADFLALEALRLFHLPLYREIQQNKSKLTGFGPSDSLSPRSRSQEKRDPNFLLKDRGLSRETRNRLRDGLPKLFPSLQNIWKGEHNMSSSSNEERRNRQRVCYSPFFDTYFRLSYPEEARVIGKISQKVQNLIKQSQNGDFIRETFIDAATKPYKGEGTETEASVMLGMLLHRVDNQLNVSRVMNLLLHIFTIADKLRGIPARRRPHFQRQPSSDKDRLFPIVLQLYPGKRSVHPRTNFLFVALRSASPEWKIELTHKAFCDYYSDTEDSRKDSIGDKLMTKEGTDKAIEMALDTIETRAKSGNFMKVQDFEATLRRWQEMAMQDRRPYRADSWLCETISKGGARGRRSTRALLRAIRAAREGGLLDKKLKPGSDDTLPELVYEFTSSASEHPIVLAFQKLADSPFFLAKLEALAGESRTTEEDRETIRQIQIALRRTSAGANPDGTAPDPESSPTRKGGLPPQEDD